MSSQPVAWGPCADDALRGIESRGPDALAESSGPWALVLWDRRSQRYLAYSDPIGTTPLYWARTASGGVAFSTSISWLVDRPDVDDALDYEGILLHELAQCRTEASQVRTRFRAVSLIPGGHRLEVGRDGGITLRRYWDPAQVAAPDESMSISSAVEQLRAAIDTAVRRLTPTDAVVGAHLSGGLDCTAVACRAHQVLTERGGELAYAYSWSPSPSALAPQPGDERELILATTEANGFTMRWVDPSTEDDWFSRRDVNRFPWSTQFGERSVLPQAEADGVTVLLSGWGGDEFASFPGRDVVGAYVRSGRLASVWRESGGLGGRDIGRRDHLRQFGRAIAGAWKSPAEHWSPEDERIDQVLRSYSAFAADSRRERLDSYRAARTSRAFQELALRHGHLQERTAAWHQAGQHFGVSYRYPLLDLDVVTTALSLPYTAWQYQGWRRAAFRLAIEPWVPPAVAWNRVKAEPALRQAARGSRRPSPLPPQDEELAEVMRVVQDARRRDIVQPSTPSPVSPRPDLRIRL